MRAGILSVARKALDGCSLMNTLAAQVAADLGYATEAGPENDVVFFSKNERIEVFLNRDRFKRTYSHLPTSNFQGIFVSFRGGQFFFYNRGWFRDVS